MLFHVEESDDSCVSWDYGSANAVSSNATYDNGEAFEDAILERYPFTWAAAAGALVIRFADFVKRKQLVIASVIFVIMDMFLTVHYKRLMDHTSNYTLVTMETLTICIFTLFSIIYVICLRLFPKYMARPFNIRPLLGLSLLDIASNGLSAVGSARTSGILLTLLGQVVIPLTMFSSKLILGKHYNGYQYLGAFMILTFVAIKEFTLPPSSDTNDFKANMIYLSASIPDSIAASVRSAQYSSESFHLVKYQHTAAALQFVFGVPIFAVFMSQHLTRNDLGVFGGIWHDVKAGLACLFLGRNTIVDQCGPGDLLNCDNCEGGLRVLAVYMVCNVIIRMAYIVIMMHGVVTLTFLLGTLKVPLCSIAFSLPFISGESTSKFDVMDVYCFAGIMCSLFIYGMGSKLLPSSSSSASLSHNEAAEPMLDECDRSDCSLLFDGTVPSSNANYP